MQVLREVWLCVCVCVSESILELGYKHTHVSFTAKVSSPQLEECVIKWKQTEEAVGVELFWLVEMSGTLSRARAGEESDAALGVNSQPPENHQSLSPVLVPSFFSHSTPTHPLPDSR